MRRTLARPLAVALGGTLLGSLATATAFAQGAPLMLGAPSGGETVRVAQTPTVQPPTVAAKPAAAPAQKPVAQAAKPVAAPAKPGTAQAQAPAAGKPATAAAAAKPAAGAAKPAKTVAPSIPPEARRAALLAAMTGQTTPPKHDHVFANVQPTACPGNPDAIGVSRVMKVDTNGGFYVGQTYHTRLPLEPKEVVLTFDDGPMAGRTERVLEALDKECTKATFFIVGQMAKAYPETLRKTARAGHSIAYHTMTHPLNMVKWPLAKAQDNIQGGWQVVDQILYGQTTDHPATPFFRYPGLFNSRAINEWFNGLNMGVWAIDAAGNDWLKGYITLADGPNVQKRALAEIEARQGGILLLHDIKDSSSSIVGPLLRDLKARGYKIVHIVPKDPPPKLVDGPVKGVLPTVAETTVPVGERSLDSFDAAKRLAQQGEGRTGKTSTAPLPAYQAATAATPAAAVSTAPAAAPTAATGEPETTGSVPAAKAAKSDGWFSASASSFRGFGGALGLW